MFVYFRPFIGNTISRWICTNGSMAVRNPYIHNGRQLIRSYSISSKTIFRNPSTAVQQQQQTGKLLSSHKWNSSSTSSTNPRLPSSEAASNPTIVAATTTTKLTLEEEARAEKMFAELKDLMIKRQQRIEAEQSKSWFDSMQVFWNSSKNQLINVAAAFACVLMAIQVTDAKISERKSLAYAKETEDDMNKLKHSLHYICSENFANGIATNYSETAISVQQNHDLTIDDDKSNGRQSSWLLYLLNSRRTRNDPPQYDTVVDTHTLASIIRQHIKSVLGENYPLTDAERVEIEVQQLQKFLGSGNELNPSAQALVTTVGEIEESLDEEDGTKIIKKRKIMF